MQSKVSMGVLCLCFFPFLLCELLNKFKPKRELKVANRFVGQVTCAAERGLKSPDFAMGGTKNAQTIFVGRRRKKEKRRKVKGKEEDVDEWSAA